MSDGSAEGGTVVVVSGYFNPIHIGHVRMLEAAAALGDKLVVIVNNDRQQQLKKGKVIMGEDERLEIVRAIRWVDEALIALDDDPSIVRTLDRVARDHAGADLIFANGGDRQSADDVPEAEVCARHGIDMRFGVGGFEKLNSSSNINRSRGAE